MAVVIGEGDDAMVASCASFVLVDEIDEVLFTVNVYNSGMLYDGFLPYVDPTTKSRDCTLLGITTSFPTPCVLHRIKNTKALLIKH